MEKLFPVSRKANLPDAESPDVFQELEHSGIRKSVGRSPVSLEEGMGRTEIAVEVTRGCQGHFYGKWAQALLWVDIDNPDQP
jgi:hypothetical protein